jgi:hypothetical protein
MPPPQDIQESLKILRFRFRRKVRFRPILRRSGRRYYSVDGTLRPEPEILLWATSGRRPPSQ